MHCDAETYRCAFANKAQAQLSRAMEQGLIESVDRVLKKGVDLACGDWNALYALSVIACPYRFLRQPELVITTQQILRSLLNAGATDLVGQSDDSAMNNFIKMGSVELVRIMLESGIRPTPTDLSLACRLKDQAIFDLLIEHQAPVNELATDGFFWFMPITSIFQHLYSGDWSISNERNFSVWFDNIDTRTVFKLNALIESTYRKRKPYKEKVEDQLAGEHVEYLVRAINMINTMLGLGATITAHHVVLAIKSRNSALVVAALRAGGFHLFDELVTLDDQECSLLEFLKQHELWPEIRLMLGAVA